MHVTESQRRQIEELHNRYIRLIDDGRLEEWPDLFTDYCLYRIATRDGDTVMECRGQGMLADRVRIGDEQHHYSHQISGLWIESFDGETAVCRSNYLVLRDAGIFSAGTYLDKIALDGPEAKFEERVVLADAPLVDQLLVVPI
jgi:anthranilate 1,2-dioxygenase small subunit